MKKGLLYVYTGRGRDCVLMIEYIKPDEIEKRSFGAGCTDRE